MAITKHNPMRTSEGLFKLVYKGTNIIVSEGSFHRSSNEGAWWQFRFPLPPHKPGSSGKIEMVNNNWNQLFYPQVFEMEFVKV